MEDPNKTKEYVSGAAGDIGEGVAEIGAEVAAEGIIESVVWVAGEVIGGSAEVAGEAIGGVFDGI